MKKASKKEQLIRDLSRMITEKLDRHDFRFPTEAALCRMFSLSRVTVRNALQELEQEGLVIRKQGSRTLLSGKYPDPSRNQIALLLEDPSRYRSPAILNSVRTCVGNAGFSLSVYALQQDPFREREILSGFLSHPPRGIILECAAAGEDPCRELLEKLTGEEHRIPAVFLFQSPFGSFHALPQTGTARPSSVSVVAEDTRQGAAKLAQALRALGHRRLAAVFPACTQPDAARFSSLLTACFETGLTIPKEAVFLPGNQETEALLEGKSPLLSSFLQKAAASCTVLVCSDDLMAAALLRGLSREGLRVPEDLSLVSFETSYLHQLPQLGIAGLRCQENPGKAAAELLLRQIRGETAGSRLLPLSFEPAGSLRRQ